MDLMQTHTITERYILWKLTREFQLLHEMQWTKTSKDIIEKEKKIRSTCSPRYQDLFIRLH